MHWPTNGRRFFRQLVFVIPSTHLFGIEAGYGYLVPRLRPGYLLRVSKANWPVYCRWFDHVYHDDRGWRCTTCKSVICSLSRGAIAIGT